MLHPLDNHCRFEHLTSWVAHLQNLKRCGKNLQLSTEHPSVVDAYLRNNPVQTVSPAFRTHPPYSDSNQMHLVLYPKVTTREMAVNCWPFCPWRIQHKWLHWQGPPLWPQFSPHYFHPYIRYRSWHSSIAAPLASRKISLPKQVNQGMER